MQLYKYRINSCYSAQIPFLFPVKYRNVIFVLLMCARHVYAHSTECKRFAIFDFILRIHRQWNVWIICFIGKSDSLAVYTCIDLAREGLFRHGIR